MNRKKILDKINELIESEHGNELTEDSLLTDCEIDSFGYAVIWLGFEHDIVKQDNKDCKIFSEEYINSIDYKTYKVKEIIDILYKAQNVSK